MTATDLAWQPSLFDLGAVTFDHTFRDLSRRDLGSDAWIDFVPAWLKGAGTLFEELLHVAPWSSRVIHMYERKIAEPRLTTRWQLGQTPKGPGRTGQSGKAPKGPGWAGQILAEGGAPLPVIGEMAEILGERYGVQFTSVGCNLYRDGSDSVAWHGDRIARDLPEATIAIVSVGEPRAFRLRAKGGGRSVAYRVGGGDLLVMGGSCQRTWDHAVPKVAAAGPRISITFRHAYD